MERRAYPRHHPKEDVIVALFWSTQHETNSIIGQLLDISKAGFAFLYTPLNSTIVQLQSPCEVMIKTPVRPFMKPIPAEVVYNIQLGIDTFGSLISIPKIRYGIRFTSLLSASDIRGIVRT